MDTKALLLDLFSRIPPIADSAVADLSPAQLAQAPAPDANTVAWLVWHLARVQDSHVSELLETDQLWVTAGWAERFSLPPDPSNTGYSHSSDDVAAVQPEGPDILLAYLAGADERTRQFVHVVDDELLDQVVDRHYDPPVTVGVRLISVAIDCLQHVGQAAYVGGVVRRAG